MFELVKQNILLKKRIKHFLKTIINFNFLIRKFVKGRQTIEFVKFNP